MLTRVGWALLAVLVAAGCAVAASWQYGRGVGKEAMLAAYAAALQAAPVALDAGLAVAGDLPVRVAGVLHRSQAPWILLDNQIREGRAGVRAYALVQPPAGQPLLLADFGWLPLGTDRALPALPEMPATLDASGLLVALPGQGMRLAPNPPLHGAEPALVTYLDPAELAAQLQRPIAGRVLRIDAGVPFGFARDAALQPAGLPPERHYGYALQWAGLSATVIAVYIILSLRRSRA